MLNTVDIGIALEKMHQLQHEGGDLGAQYWYEISRLLLEAHKYKVRALVAEARLAEIAKANDRDASMPGHLR
jgi:hypothetical protein